MISEKLSNEQWLGKKGCTQNRPIQNLGQEFFAFVHIPVNYPERMSRMESLPNINSWGFEKECLGWKN